MHGRQFHGDFRRRGQENHGKSLLANSFAGAGDARRRSRAADGGRAARVFPVVHQDGFHVRMAFRMRTSSAPL